MRSAIAWSSVFTFLAASAACSDDAADPGATTTATGTGGAGGAGTTTSSASSGGGGADTASGGGGEGGGLSGPNVVGGTRPAEVYIPSSYDPAVPMPLLVMLHGYTVTGDVQEAYLQIEPHAEERGFLYVHPNGTVDPTGAPFWNATDGCCDFFRSEVDDSKYLADLVEEIRGKWNVDPDRIFFAGHSNGGFMSYRMACEHAGTIAAIASLAGAMWIDPADCTPSEPVAVLQMHGTADDTILYDGGDQPVMGWSYPSAHQTAEAWVTLDGCDPTPDASGAPRDLDGELEGDETTVEAWSGCDAGTGVELWTIDGGSHIPAISDTFVTQVLDFLFAHPKSSGGAGGGGGR